MLKKFIITGLLIAPILTLISCETSVDHRYTTRWFYQGDKDPWKSRASGPTQSHGFTSFNQGKEETK